MHIKKGGLFHGWLRLVPEGQADAFVDRVVAKKYEGLNEFMKDFFTFVEENSKMSDYTRRVRRKGKKFNGLFKIEDEDEDEQEQGEVSCEEFHVSFLSLKCCERERQRERESGELS
jgi:hypothetical protein